MTIGSKYIFRENLASTNEYASAILKNQSPPEGTIIYTNFQTAGRGHGNNSWESEENKNLLISLILYPNIISPIDQFIISKTISLGICDFLNQYIDNIFIKWPNDIYVNNDKIAGILIEASVIENKLQNMIAGIGLNINQKQFSGNSPNPVSLGIITGKVYNIEEALFSLANYLDLRYEQLLSGNRTLINEEYLRNLYRYNCWALYSDSTGVFEGRILSADLPGHLGIEDRSGKIREFSFKEVRFL